MDNLDIVIDGMTATGRHIVGGPAVEIIELESDAGLKHLALVHSLLHAAHPLLSSELQGSLGFMEEPDITGLARMVGHDPEMGAFVYATGAVWTVADVVRTYAEEGEVAGIQAALELCYLVAQILTEAGDAATEHGLSNHRNLNPWNIVLKADGQPQLIGYGIPQVELATWREGAVRILTEDSFRYASPERMEGSDEDLSTDLFSLALVGLEVMTGKPVYDGVADDVRQQAARGEGMRRLYQWRDLLPSEVREVFGRALKPDMDTRYGSGLDFVHDLHGLLRELEVEGPSLLEAVAHVRAVGKRGRAVMGGATAMITPEDRAEMAADLQEFEPRVLPPPSQPRPADRAPRSAEDDEPEPVPAAPDGEPPRWQAPSRSSSGDTPRKRRRLRRSGGDSPSERREMLRRRIQEESAAKDAEEERPAAALLHKLRSSALQRSDSEVTEPPPRRAPPTPPAPDPSPTPVPLPTPVPDPTPPPRPTVDDDVELPDDQTSILAMPSETTAIPVPESRTASSPESRPLDFEDEDVPTEMSGHTGAFIGAPGIPHSMEGVELPRGQGRDEAPTEMYELPTPRALAETPEPPRPTESPAPQRPPPTPDPRTAVVSPPSSGPTLVSVSRGSRSARLSVREGERAASLAMRAAMALGGLPTDPSGRLIGTFRLVADGQGVQGTATVAELGPGPFQLELVRGESRQLSIVVMSEPQRGMRTPVQLSVPASWLAAGLADSLMLPEGDWAFYIHGRRVPGDVPLGESLGDGMEIILAPRPPR